MRTPKILLAALTLLAAYAIPANAQTAANHPAANQTGAAQAATIAPLTIEAGTGRMVTVPVDGSDVFVADPKVVDVRPASPGNLFVFGVGPGHTSIAVTDKNGGKAAVFDVTITPSNFAAGEAASAIGRALPMAHINVQASTKGMVLTGQVADARTAEAAQGIAHAFVGDGQEVENRLTVNSPMQVGLRVRIAEMSRNVTNALGINWQALGSIGRFGVMLNTATGVSVSTATNSTLNIGTPDVNALINALAQDNLVRVLAEPNLTAISGESASFLAGGEFPIPVGQANNTVTIEFKQYGVALAFVPTVVSDRQIRLRVRPEVSELTQQGAVQISAGNNSIQVPALTVRRADTTVELGSGQSFAIAGLLQYNASTMASYVPMLGDVPVLGELFRSNGFQRNETELVIIVTPYLIDPVNSPSALHLPGEKVRMKGDVELMLSRRTGRPSGPVAGDAGFEMP